MTHYFRTSSSSRAGPRQPGSHAAGPIRAGHHFAMLLKREGLFERTLALQVDLRGALGTANRSQACGRAVMLGLLGRQPDSADPDHVATLVAATHRSGRLRLLGERPVVFDASRDIRLLPDALPLHREGLTMRAFALGGVLLCEKTYDGPGEGTASADENEFQPHERISATGRSLGSIIASHTGR